MNKNEKVKIKVQIKTRLKRIYKFEFFQKFILLPIMVITIESQSTIN